MDLALFWFPLVQIKGNLSSKMYSCTSEAAVGGNGPFLFQHVTARVDTASSKKCFPTVVWNNLYDELKHRM